MVFCYRLGGKPLFSLFLAPAILYFYLCRVTARKASIEYLQRVRKLDSSLASEHLHLQSFKHFWQFGQAIIDKLAVWMGDITEQSLVSHNSELIENLLATGTGGILLISHLGNFEITRCLSSRHKNLKLTVLMHTKHASKFNDVLSQHSEDSKVEILEVTEINPATAMMMSERIERGEFIAIAGDRIPVTNKNDKGVLYADFLGSKTAFPTGAYILASIFKAPILSIMCLQKNKKYHVYFDLLSAKVAPNRKDRQQTFQQLTQDYADLLQRHCLTAPLQWFNFFDFWAQTQSKQHQSQTDKD